MTHSRLFPSFQQSGESKDATGELPGSATLIQWLSGLDGGNTEGTTTALTRIIENDGRGTYAQFGFPIAGLPTSGQEVERLRRGRRVSVATSQIPDVLPIKLPTGEENPLGAASPKSKRRKQPADALLNGVVDLQFPELESKADDSQQVQSAAVKTLLGKIPDLSFMLESKLVLPSRK
jgi:hypothetical protein